MIQRVGGDEDIPVNIRIIAATHRELTDMVSAGTFRRDLYYRLNVMPLSLPPLRDRREDIPFLAHTLLDRLRKKVNKRADRISPEALRLLISHHWPGNVRELENTIERGLILAGEAPVLTEPHLFPEGLVGPKTETGGTPWSLIDTLDWSSFSQFFEQGGSFDDLLRRIEWAITKRAVNEHHGNKSHAARTLKRSYRWLRKLEKEHTDSPPSSSA
jgi:transcriptional regulator with PAS, ATPase and Fis domain